ncbi:MAG: sensor histidine kinase [Methanoculleaceae archaeon]
MVGKKGLPGIAGLLSFEIPREISDIPEWIEELEYPAFALDAEGHVIAWNRMIEELTGVDRRAILGEGEYAHGAALFVERRPTLADAVITGGSIYPYRWYDVRAVENGRVVAASRVSIPTGKSSISLAVPLYDGDTCAGSLEIIFPGPPGIPQTDSLSEVFAHFDDLLIVLEASGIISHFSWTDAEKYGMDPDTVRGKRVADVFSVDDAATLIKKADEVRETGETTSFQRTLKCGSELCSFRIIMTPAVPVGDKPRPVIAICRPDPSIPHLTEEVEKTRRIAELLNRLISNDIYNGNLVAATAAAILEERLDDEGKEVLRRLQDAIAQNNLAIKNVELLQTLDQHRMPVEPVNLGELIEKAIKQFPGADISYPGTDACVWANELLEIVFSNLISNSLRHGGLNVKITITVSAQPESVTVVVADNGRGIPDAEKPTIFNIFSQSGFETPERRGLGLHIVRTLVTSYGGKVWAGDRIPGRSDQGAAFKVMLHRC